MTTWINVKAGAEMVGIGEHQFRREWTPEDDIPQVNFRVTNGRAGRGRRIEVDLEDLERVLAERIHERVI